MASWSESAADVSDRARSLARRSPNDDSGFGFKCVPAASLGASSVPFVRAARTSPSAVDARSCSPRANAASPSRMDVSARANASAAVAADASDRKRFDCSSRVAARRAMSASTRLVSRPGNAVRPKPMWSSSSASILSVEGGARSASAATVLASASDECSRLDARARCAASRIPRRSAAASASRRSPACCSASRLSSAPSGTCVGGGGSGEGWDEGRAGSRHDERDRGRHHRIRCVRGGYQAGGWIQPGESRAGLDAPPWIARRVVPRRPPRGVTAPSSPPTVRSGL